MPQPICNTQAIQQRLDRYGLTADSLVPVIPSTLTLDWSICQDENVPALTRLYLLYLARGDELFTWSGAAIAHVLGVDRQIGRNYKYLIAKKVGKPSPKIRQQ